MDSKEELLTKLTDVYNRWEKALAAMSEKEITTRDPASGLSIKDVLGHLLAWQQRSIARMEAALYDKEPVYPAWASAMSPYSEEDVDRFNAIIHQIYQDQPWSKVHDEWSAGFRHFLELVKEIDEEALSQVGMYPWLPDYSLGVVIEGSLDHHQEHLEELTA